MSYENKNQVTANRDRELEEFLTKHRRQTVSNGATVTPEVPVDSEKPNWFPNEGEENSVWCIGGYMQDSFRPFCVFTSEAAAWAGHALPWVTGSKPPYTRSLEYCIKHSQVRGRALEVLDEQLRVIEVYR